MRLDILATGLLYRLSFYIVTSSTDSKSSDLSFRRGFWVRCTREGATKPLKSMSTNVHPTSRSQRRRNRRQETGHEMTGCCPVMHCQQLPPTTLRQKLYQESATKREGDDKSHFQVSLPTVRTCCRCHSLCQIIIDIGVICKIKDHLN